MEHAAFAEASVVKNGSNLEAVHGTDDGLIVCFYLEAEYQQAASEKENRPIFADVPYIWIRFPGDNSRELKQKAKDHHKRRFPQQWAAFEQQKEEVHEGTPLSEWGPVSKSLALNYKGLSIHTVEQLAAVPDSALQGMGHGARPLRDKAIVWVEQARGAAPLLELKAENERLKDDLSAKDTQISELSQRLSALEAKGA